MTEEPNKQRGSSHIFTAWLALFILIVVVMTIVGFVTNVPQKPPYPIMVFIIGTVGAIVLLCLWMFFRWFVRWLCCWRNLRRALVRLAGLATLIAIFYTVENFRGKRAWENYKREAKSKGVELDWNALIPPPVPADQNFFDAPKMAEWFIRQHTGKPNTNEFRNRLGYPTNLTPEFTTETAARDYLAWSDQCEPDFDVIREAVKRPYSRIGGGYSQPFAIRIPDFVTVRTLVQTLAWRAKCALLIGEPEKALRELTLMHDLCCLLEGKPTGKPMTLVAAMINVAVTGLYVDAIANGVQLKAWREPELAALQEQLQKINLLPFVESGFECERAGVCRTFETLTPNELSKIFLNKERKNLWEKLESPIFVFLTLAPRGWVYQNMITHAEQMKKTLSAIDSTNHLIMPRKQAEASMAVEEVVAHLTPYTYLSSISIPNFLKATQSLARNQTMANQAFMVCALERYRLAHEKYPETLDALVPQFMEKVPHDVVSGQPLIYRRIDDEKFLLYSIGWNEKDDDGTSASISTDHKQGDWVWPIPIK